MTSAYDLESRFPTVGERPAATTATMHKVRAALGVADGPYGLARTTRNDRLVDRLMMWSLDSAPTPSALSPICTRHLGRPIRASDARLAVRMAQCTHRTDHNPEVGPSEAVGNAHCLHGLSHMRESGRRHGLRGFLGVCVRNPNFPKIGQPAATSGRHRGLRGPHQRPLSGLQGVQTPPTDAVARGESTLWTMHVLGLTPKQMWYTFVYLASVRRNRPSTASAHSALG